MAGNSLFKGTLLEGKVILEIDGQYRLVQRVTIDEISRSECLGEHYSYTDPKTGKKNIYHIQGENTRFCKILGATTLSDGIKPQDISSFLTINDINALIEDTYSDENLNELNARLEEESRKKLEK